MVRHKWDIIPGLNYNRFESGSVLLQSKRAFSFGGSVRYLEDLNRIESLQMECDTDWKTLPINYSFPQCAEGRAVSFLGKIILIGQKFNGSSFDNAMFEFSEEGELEGNLSADPLIPKSIEMGCFTVRQDMLFTFDQYRFKGEKKQQMKVFNGFEWTIL